MRTLENMPRWLRDLLAEFKGAMSALYGDRLGQLVLYGSWARGEGREDSDVDIVVVLQGQVSPGEEIDRMIDTVTDLQIERGIVLSIYPVSDESYRTTHSPLLENVRREGIAA